MTSMWISDAHLREIIRAAVLPLQTLRLTPAATSYNLLRAPRLSGTVAACVCSSRRRVHRGDTCRQVVRPR